MFATPNLADREEASGHAAVLRKNIDLIDKAKNSRKHHSPGCAHKNLVTQFNDLDSRAKK
jgi:hypothetical protein